jgi:fumarylacetoacetase
MTHPTRLDETHDVGLRSWVASANSGTTDFPIQNLPLGVFRRRGDAAPAAIGVAIGDQILSLRRASERDLLDGLRAELRAAAEASTLNPLMALGHDEATAIRRRVSRILAAGSVNPDERLLTPMSDADLFVPAKIGNYSDFYASIHHATNVGKLFRPDNPLLPNYRYVPIAYHGRSSSIVPSGAGIKRPWGQVKGIAEAPEYRASARLDYEAEVGCFCGPGNALGDPIPIDAAEAHLFGLCLVNDWSARDIQAWEYQPLGPFLGKSFGTTISPWVVTYDALAPFRCAAFTRTHDDPAPLEYLSSRSNETSGGFDVTFEVFLRSANMRRDGVPPVRLSRSSLRDLYWTLAQMVTHHTSNGCNLLPGDLIATGTLSGPSKSAQGSLIEITEGGKAPLHLPNGESRTFLEEGDEVIMRAFCEREGYARIGFGDCAGRIT